MLSFVIDINLQLEVCLLFHNVIIIVYIDQQILMM